MLQLLKTKRRLVCCFTTAGKIKGGYLWSHGNNHSYSQEYCLWWVQWIPKSYFFISLSKSPVGTCPPHIAYANIFLKQNYISSCPPLNILTAHLLLLQGNKGNLGPVGPPGKKGDGFPGPQVRWYGHQNWRLELLSKWAYTKHLFHHN